MPAFDGTGPRGLGQLTGRGIGLCGSRQSYGRGFGRGCACRWQQPQLTKEQEKELLEQEKQDIEQRLKELK